MNLVILRRIGAEDHERPPGINAAADGVRSGWLQVGPRPGAGADGDDARVPHHPGLLGNRVADDRAAGRAPRALIEESITPVWEANHVWLVFDLVIFWTAFPHAFAAVMTALALPLWLAGAGIVLRGAGFAFRKEITRLPWQRAAGAVFAFSSLLTPFFMGTVVGAIAAGAVPAGASQASLAVLALLTAGRPKGTRAIAALGVAAVVWGWGVAQYPVLLPGTTLTLNNAGALPATYTALVVVSLGRCRGLSGTRRSSGRWASVRWC